MGDALQQLMHWAEAQGVVVSGIQPQRMPLKGVGIVATKPIEAGEVILDVPTSVLRTIQTVRESISAALPPSATTHCRLALDLALGDDGFAAWNAVLPSREDVEDSMPLCWPAALQAQLPLAARQKLTRQKARLQRDWTAVAAAHPPFTGVREADFRYAWMLVNSRTFYHTTPETERSLPRDDRMAMQPVADLFNHAAAPDPDAPPPGAAEGGGGGGGGGAAAAAAAANGLPNGNGKGSGKKRKRQEQEGHHNQQPATTVTAGCKMAYDAAGFTATATRAHAAGEEVTVSYGRHSNDELLVEYGFILQAAAAPPSPHDRAHEPPHQPLDPSLRWDETPIDDALLLPPRLSARHRDLLDAAGFLGGWILDARTPVCHRTQVALRVATLPLRRWRRFVAEGQDDESEGARGEYAPAAVQRRADALLLDALVEYRAGVVQAAVASLESSKAGKKSQREMLLRRWRQIGALLDRTIEQLKQN